MKIGGRVCPFIKKGRGGITGFPRAVVSYGHLLELRDGDDSHLAQPAGTFPGYGFAAAAADDADGQGQEDRNPFLIRIRLGRHDDLQIEVIPRVSGGNQRDAVVETDVVPQVVRVWRRDRLGQDFLKRGFLSGAGSWELGSRIDDGTKAQSVGLAQIERRVHDK